MMSVDDVNVVKDYFFIQKNSGNFFRHSESIEKCVSARGVCLHEVVTATCLTFTSD